MNIKTEAVLRVKSDFFHTQNNLCRLYRDACSFYGERPRKDTERAGKWCLPVLVRLIWWGDLFALFHHGLECSEGVVVAEAG